MRNHPRPFVVEVKRGTSRQSFQSHTSDSDKFSAAEKLLFSKVRAEPVASAAVPLTQPGQSGRVLPALSDVNDIVLADPFPTPRRGRPPGSKNKVKLIDEALPREAVLPSMLKTASDVIEVEPRTADDRRNVQSLDDDEVFLTPVLPDPPAALTKGPTRATRLRDRSRILRRYVLGTEPRAGERKSFRKKRNATSNGKREG